MGQTLVMRDHAHPTCHFVSKKQNYMTRNQDNNKKLSLFEYNTACLVSSPTWHMNSVFILFGHDEVLHYQLSFNTCQVKQNHEIMSMTSLTPSQVLLSMSHVIIVSVCHMAIPCHISLENVVCKVSKCNPHIDYYWNINGLDWPGLFFSSGRLDHNLWPDSFIYWILTLPGVWPELGPLMALFVWSLNYFILSKMEYGTTQNKVL